MLCLRNRVATPLLPSGARVPGWRNLVRRLVTRASREGFVRLDQAGMHVLRKSYYSSVPDFAWLGEHEALWRRPIAIRGVDWSLDEQARWLEAVCGEYAHEVADPWYEQVHSAHLGQGFGPIDAMVLHCFVRRVRPARIVEVGGGESTGILAAASHRNEEEGAPASRITSIEPYASPELLALDGVEVLRESAQAVPDSLFGELGAGDLLFIDSTHTVKTGSEVLRLFLEVIPALPAGVHVHVHDVVLPYLYTRSFGSNPYDWQESSLLLALLVDNARLRLRFCGSAVGLERPDAVRRMFPSYRPRGVDRGLWDPNDRGGHSLFSAYLETR